MLGFMRDKMVRRSLSQLNQSCMSVYSPVHEPVSRYCSSCEAGFCADCSNKVHATKFMAQHCVVDSKQQVHTPATTAAHCKTHPGRPNDLYCIDCEVGYGVAIEWMSLCHRT